MFWSEPSTARPSSRASAARPPMNVPQMPRTWMRVLTSTGSDTEDHLDRGPVDDEEQGRKQESGLPFDVEGMTQDVPGDGDVPDAEQQSEHTDQDIAGGVQLRILRDAGRREQQREHEQRQHDTCPEQRRCGLHETPGLAGELERERGQRETE